jgi:hypothetical protein
MLTLRIFAPLREINFRTRLLTQRRKGAKETREVRHYLRSVVPHFKRLPFCRVKGIHEIHEGKL